MKAVIQRVRNASVSVNDTVRGSIGKGLVILIGIAKEDNREQASLLADKVRLLRIFEDENGKLNHSLEDINGEALVISQFTLCADTGKGRRPSFTDAAPFNDAMELYQHFIQKLRQSGIRVETGEFGERMLVAIHNEGPVTVILETEREKEA